MEHQRPWRMQRVQQLGGGARSEIQQQVAFQLEHGHGCGWNPFRDHQHRHKDAVKLKHLSSECTASDCNQHPRRRSMFATSTSASASSSSTSFSGCCCGSSSCMGSSLASTCSSSSYRGSCGSFSNSLGSATARTRDPATRASCSALMMPSSSSSCKKPPRGLRKFGQKVKSFFSKHRSRDTIYCEDDETELESSRGSNGWSCCDESEMRSTTASIRAPSGSIRTDGCAARRQHSRINNNSNRDVQTNANASAAPTPSGHAFEFYEQLYQVEEERRNSEVQLVTPSADQRWCRNCSKCFQRSRSPFDQFCGLDCKTAFRFRRCCN